jgi:Rad3-related DNA helicase
MNQPIDAVEITRMDLERLGKTIYDEQKEMITPMFEALQKKGVVFVGQGPPGMGKTYVVAGVTKALVQQGKRVCIAVPSYAHLKDVMGKHLSDLGVEYATLRGLSALEKDEGCPLLKGKLPTPIFCSDMKGASTGPMSEKCKTLDCTVRKEQKKASEAKVVLTVFHKLIYKSGLLKDFDVIIFDESHGLETALRNARIIKVRRSDVSKMLEQFPQHKDVFDKLVASIDRLASRPKDEVPTTFVERQIIEPLKQIFAGIQENMRKLEETGKSGDEKLVNAYYSLYWSVNSLERLDQYRFVYHNETVLGIPLKITFNPFQTMSTNRENSIALISATIESARFHANDSGFQFHTLAPPIQIQSMRLIETRYRKRPIVGLVDGPILKIDPSDRSTYFLAREEADHIVGTIVPLFKYPSLILCRNGEDAKSIANHLEKIREIKDRLYVFEDEDTKLELDAIETKLNKMIEKGQNIIVTTAASRLWEGANLKGLRFLVIDALPYASPQPYEKFETTAWGSWRTSKTFRFMIRKLQQGVGRLIRTDDDPWGLVTIVDGRFNAQWGTIRSVLPSYLKDPKILKFVTRQKLRDELIATITKLENGEFPAI